jgi:hypothetical protein
VTVFVVEPTVRGDRMKQPVMVKPPHDQGENLHYLIAQHPECIYYTDNEAEFFGTTLSVLEQMEVTYELWERDLNHPETMPRKCDPKGHSSKDAATVRNWADVSNTAEMYRARYQFFPVKVTTTRTLEEI